MNAGKHQQTSSADVPSDLANSSSCEDGGVINDGTDENTIRIVRALPFIRRVRYHMDSCAGTNKSQYVFGGLGMLAATGVLDAIQVHYMVVGHTKFGPDLVARAIAGEYQRQDTFNHAHLIGHISKYASAHGYDEELLLSWRRASHLLFSAIPGIMSYRCFFILADDGNVSLQPVEKLPEHFQRYQWSGEYYNKGDLLTESELLSRRSLKEKVIPQLLDGSYRGVGEGFEGHWEGDKRPRRILPSAVTKVNKARLFVQRTESDDICFEVRGWMTDSSTEMMNKVLRIVTGYDCIGGMEKSPYGSKRKQIEEQYFKYVDPCFVPDRFAVAEEQSNTAQSAQRDRHVIQSTFSSEGTVRVERGSKRSTRSKPMSNRTAGQSNLQKPRWKASEHTEILVKLIKDHFDSTVPSRPKDWHKLSQLMPRESGEHEWEPRTIKRHAKKLQDSGRIE